MYSLELGQDFILVLYGLTKSSQFLYSLTSLAHRAETFLYCLPGLEQLCKNFPLNFINTKILFFSKALYIHWNFWVGGMWGQEEICNTTYFFIANRKCIAFNFFSIWNIYLHCRRAVIYYNKILCLL